MCNNTDEETSFEKSDFRNLPERCYTEEYYLKEMNQIKESSIDQKSEFITSSSLNSPLVVEQPRVEFYDYGQQPAFYQTSVSSSYSQ